MNQPLEPLDPRDAFAVPSGQGVTPESVTATQAALLLAMRAGVMGIRDTELEDFEQDARDSAFTLPDLRALKRRRRLRVPEATRSLQMSASEMRAAQRAGLEEAMSSAVQRLYDKPDTENAAALFEGGMLSPHPLVRVAAAAGARETTRLRPEILRILRTQIDSPDPLVAELARVALGAIRPNDPVLLRHVSPPPPSSPRAHRSYTSVLTHGTWGSDCTWYKPGGDFYAALDAHRPDLHLHDRSFEWSGSYSDAGRRVAARQLAVWLADQGLTNTDFFAHSHGGTVANLATSNGVRFNRLVLMGWPVHPQWFPAPSGLQQVVDIRVRLDLVIMADRGGQQIRNAAFPVQEYRNGWFDHTSVHTPAYWEEHRLWSVV